MDGVDICFQNEYKRFHPENIRRTVSLASLLFTDYRRRVLGLLLLHPERSYHLREIARVTAASAGTLTRELGRLTEAGVLRCERIGNQAHYSANRSCPIFEELAAILRKTSGLADVLSEGLDPVAGKIEAAFVFGSMASGKAQAGSDIDLLVIGDLGLAEVLALLHPLQETLGREINPKLYTPDEWAAAVARNSAFIRDVLDKPKLFVVGDEATLDRPSHAP